MKSNPKITKYISRQEKWQQDILARLRKLIFKADPDVEEELKWGSPWFGHNGKQIAWSFCAKDWVHFSFSQGALLGHDHGLFEETDNKAMRTIKFRQDSKIPEKLIIQLIKDSVKIIEEGREIKFNVPKPGEKTFDIPHEYESFLKENEQWDEYQSRPYYQQKGWLQWIEAAKRPETIEKRKKTMIKELKSGTYMPPKRNN